MTQLTRSGRAGSPRLSLTARAVRAALFASTAAAAFAVAPAAFAGTCVQTAPNEVTCTGVFTDDVINSVPLVNQVPGLTLILDDATTVDPATGVNGLTAQWGGDVTVLSYADITTDSADGIHQYGSDTATLSSYGDISTYVGAAGTNAIDLSALNAVSLVLGGSVDAYSDAAYDVMAVSAESLAGDTTVLVDATGYVSASAYDGNAMGVSASAFGTADVTVDGSVQSSSDYGYAAGVFVSSTQGSSYLSNYGSIGADAYNSGYAALAVAKYGDSTVYNAGDISANAYNGAALGLVAFAGGAADATNTGTIAATSTYGAAIGLVGYAGTGDVTFYNSGSISANGYDLATGVGLLSLGGDVYADNYGDITATASGDAAVLATGMGVLGYYADVYNAGSISAYATANAAVGYATAVALDVEANSINLDNTGSLYAYAYATGNGATASAADLYAADSMYVHNGGDIAAAAYGGGYAALATGVSGTAVAGGIVLVNDGSITATSDDTAVAVDLTSDTTIGIYNYGTIAAYGDAYSIAIDTSAGLSADYIYNAGSIVGAILTGAGDDLLYNAPGGEWTAVGDSDFGDGDDSVLNYGTINLTDGSSIALGGYATAAGNLFQNSGTLAVDGDASIDLGAGAGLSSSVFVNDGVIDFQDGAADDSLTIYGNFAGTGDINVDVEGDAGVSDMLYIQGDVAADADQTINVDLLDLSAPIADLIPIVEVSGTSTADNFSLGTVDFDADNSFVSLDFGLVADIDASNATPDVFSLGISVTGLTDPGTLAAAVVPGVHGLMATQVGTWRQRMGVIDSFNKGGVSLWARVFQNKGTISPGHDSDDFGMGGNFDWKQRDRGVEAGLDFAVTDEFSLGLLAAKSESDLRLESPGNAESETKADTWGVYGTWISPNGFYLDASYRWTSFDVDLASVAGPMQAEGDAETFNVEAGYAWTLAGGLKIEPQLQYTKTNVDNLDVFTTTSGMTFRADGGDSARGRVGVSVRKAFGDAETGWQVTPYGTLSAVREFDGEQFYAINDTLVGRTTTEGTSALLELGVTARHRGLSIFGGLNWQDGGAMKDFIGGQLGVRYTFGGSSPAPAPAAVVETAPVKTCADLDDDGDGVNNCDDKCVGSTAGQAVGPDGCPVPQPEPEPVMEPKPFRG